jgi:eukaryotic-like serine/threonine-protein kinase
MAKENRQILFEKFEIIDCMKKDDFSGVYVANHIFLGKRIFLKILDQKRVPDPTILDRFKREAKVLAKMEHPNIIQVYDFGTFGDFFYISFEYFESKDLRQIINEKSLTFEEKKDVLGQMLQSLDYAHRKNVIHRDIKPENILIDQNFHVKIADFGLAQLSGDTVVTAKSTLVGTPCYMSPEQVRGESLTASSDLFSIGIVGYELFTGKNLFLGNDIGTTINNILNFSDGDIEKLDKLKGPVWTVLEFLLRASESERINHVNMLGTQNEQDVQSQSKVPQMWKRVAVVLTPIVLVIFLFGVWKSNNDKNNSVEFLDNTKQLTEEKIKRQPPDEEQSVAFGPSEIKEKQTKSFNEYSKPVSAKKSTGPGKLFVQSSPWADVYIDSQKVDTTPLGDTLIVDSGNHVLALKNSAYPFYYQNVNIGPRKTCLVSVSLDTVFGFLQCNVFPWGELFIDNESVGVSPFAQPIPITPGNHGLEIKNSKYRQYKDFINITKKETLLFKLNFEALVGIKKGLVKKEGN